MPVQSLLARQIISHALKTYGKRKLKKSAYNKAPKALRAGETLSYNTALGSAEAVRQTYGRKKKKK